MVDAGGDHHRIGVLDRPMYGSEFRYLQPCDSNVDTSGMQYPDQNYLQSAKFSFLDIVKKIVRTESEEPQVTSFCLIQNLHYPAIFLYFTLPFKLGVVCRISQ